MGYDDMYSSGALTFGTFPALVVKGKGVINQSQAIARYVGDLTGLYPKDPFQSAKCDEALDGLTDVSDLITGMLMPPARTYCSLCSLVFPQPDSVAQQTQQRCRSAMLSAKFNGDKR